MKPHIRILLPYFCVLLLAFVTALPSRGAETLARDEMIELYAFFREGAPAEEGGVPFEVRSGAEEQHYVAEVLALYPGLSFGELSGLLGEPRIWCQLIGLHPNIKTCLHGQDAEREHITIFVGKKKYQEPEDAHSVRFDFSTQLTTDSFTVWLTADSGPLGTRNYQSLFQATAVPGGVFCRWHLESRLGYAGAVVDLYYRTLGRKKVGFTQTGVDGKGRPRYVRGMRGALERNFMRYYLAMKVFLATRDVPEHDQLERRINDWFEESDRFRLQLRQLTRRQYLDNKRREMANQTQLQQTMYLQTSAQ